MATTDGIYHPNLTGVAAHVPTQMSLTVDSLKGRTVRWFATTGDRDSAFASYTIDQRKGVICFVQGLGPFISDGAVWYRVSVPGFSVSRGTAQGTCDVNGIMSVDHGLVAAPVTVLVTMEGDASQIKYLNPVLVLIDSTRFLIKFWYNDPLSGALQVNAGAYTSFHWRAEL